jgi:hypothetical protein
MKWYYKRQGGHYWVRVFMNGAKCGDLCFRANELIALMEQCRVIKSLDYINEKVIIEFINEGDGH